VNILGLHRETASKYLKELEKIGILQSIKIGKSKFFINNKLFELLKKGI
jgi:Fic family protein